MILELFTRLEPLPPVCNSKVLPTLVKLDYLRDFQYLNLVTTNTRDYWTSP